MTKVLFTNCNLLDTPTMTLRRGWNVLVVGERIAEISDQSIAADTARVLNVAGRTLMPGLIDAHVHVTLSSASLATLGETPASLIAARARPILEGMIARGFTTVRDAGGADWGLAEAVERDLFVGPRLFISGQALSQTGGHADFRARTASVEPCACSYVAGGLGRIADGVDAVRRAARDELRKGASQIKVMASGGVASPNDPIANTQYSLDELRAIVEEAEAAQTYVMAHAYTPRAIRRAVECGVRSIEHGNLMDEETARLMAARGAYLVPTLATYDTLARFGAELGFPAGSLRKLEEVREAGLRALEIAKAAGVKIGFGTDLLGDMHRHQACEFALRAKVLTPAEIIRSATLTNAELLQREGRLGVIASGAYADLIVVDGNPLDDLGLFDEQGSRLAAVMKAGCFYKNRLAGG